MYDRNVLWDSSQPLTTAVPAKAALIYEIQELKVAIAPPHHKDDFFSMLSALSAENVYLKDH